jgi:type I restriction-modification system DNA methylase subunit/glutaredoxin
VQNQTLDEKLLLLDFETDSSASGLLFTRDIGDYKDDSNVSFDEILILRLAQELKASAVYFRRIEGRSSVPQIFVYDNSDNSISTDDFIDIHRKLWSSGIVSLYYVFDKTEVKIFNCRKPLQRRRETLFVEAIDSISLTSNVHAKYIKYSALLFKNGCFWELRENKDRFGANNSSYNKLIEGLRKLRNAFVKNQNETVCNKLLVLSILVKYLEERKDSRGNRVLPQKYFTKFEEAQSFCEVLRKNKGLQLFEDLGKDINGKIFELDEQEKKETAKLDQAKLANFLDANLENQQYVFWKLYDFNYLPIELISRIYEEFIPNRKDITYTPAHLVDFMIDECMPLASPKDNIKLIDVSCGSGIFLVAALKRIVQWWQKEQYKNTGEIKHPNIRKLKSILQSSIYGVDIEPEAVRLAIFSLTVAVCDMLDPTKMWEELTQEKLIDLTENVITQDFFDFITENQGRYNLVIGNPPFNSPVKDGDKKKEKEIRDLYWKRITNKIHLDFAIPDNNIALLFLQQAMKLLKRDGFLSLVIPSGPLLYNKTLGYRKKFLDKYNVPQIFDFSCLRGVLFEGRNYPIAVIFAQNSPPDDKDVLHVTIRRTRTSKEKLYFEIDKYDLYYVPKKIATTEQLIWKANLFGGGHLYYLLKRLQELRTLQEYLKEKKRHHGWFYGEGYVVGKGGRKASHLTNRRMIPTDKFNADTIKDTDIITESAKTFYRLTGKNKAIFEPPHILIRESPSLPVAFRKDYLIFKNEIVGVHSPEIQEDELLKLRSDIITNRNLYKMCLLSLSGRAGVSRSTGTILKKDIMALPYPNNKGELRLSKAEQIICDDILKYSIQQLAEGENSEVCTQDANGNILNAFAQVFCASLNSVYEEGSKQFYPLEYIESSSFICFPFAYGNPNRPHKITQTKRSQIEMGNLRSLINNIQGSNVLYKRIIKLYHRNMTFLIKPKTLRYWLKSIALRDANEVFSDLVSSGY